MTADRFTFDVLREGFAAITDEMFVSLQRTSQSPIIYEVLDFGVGLADASGELVSQGNGIAGFLGPLGDAVKETIARVRDLRPGEGRRDRGTRRAGWRATRADEVRRAPLSRAGAHARGGDPGRDGSERRRRAGRAEVGL